MIPHALRTILTATRHGASTIVEEDIGGRAAVVIAIVIVDVTATAHLLQNEIETATATANTAPTALPSTEVPTARNVATVILSLALVSAV